MIKHVSKHFRSSHQGWKGLMTDRIAPPSSKNGPGQIPVAVGIEQPACIVPIFEAQFHSH
jgi:hypothetical protein